VTRQHYGFLALYRARAGERGRLLLDRIVLYGGTWTPYLAFLVSNPRARALAGFAPTQGISPLFVALLVVFGACLVVFAVSEWTRPGRERSAPKIGYVLLAITTTGIGYFAVGSREPIYAASTTPDQDFVVVSMIASVFHAVQYVGLVWHHNARRYEGQQGDLARWASARFARYALVLLAFSIFYGALAASTGVYPKLVALAGARVGPVTANQLALALWWGIAIHHYWLDQNIWRIRGDRPLAKALGLA
jgi:hypothetical protein